MYVCMRFKHQRKLNMDINFCIWYVYICMHIMCMYYGCAKEPEDVEIERNESGGIGI